MLRLETEMVRPLQHVACGALCCNLLWTDLVGLCREVLCVTTAGVLHPSIAQRAVQMWRSEGCEAIGGRTTEERKESDRGTTGLRACLAGRREGGGGEGGERLEGGREAGSGE